jgi:hypothetical protein
VLAINICLRQPYFTMREQVVALSKVRKYRGEERVLSSKIKGGIKLSSFKRFAINKEGRALSLEYLKDVVITTDVPIQKDITKQTYELLKDRDHVLVVLYYADGKNRWVHAMANLKIGPKTGQYPMMILDPNNAAV